jgi:hypothetical protein
MIIGNSDRVDIEIELRLSGISEREVDVRTRHLAGQLRLLPHKTVGIFSKQIASSTGQSSLGPTQGRIAMSLPATTLPSVIKLILDDPTFILRGPNGTTLDLTSAVSVEQIAAWSNATIGRPIVQTEFVQTKKAANESDGLDVQTVRRHARHQGCN